MGVSKYFWKLATIGLFDMLCSCARNQTPWTDIHGSGITGDNEQAKFLHFEGHQGIFFTQEFTDQDLIDQRFDHFDAVQYNSFDDGKNWEKKKLSKGAFLAFAAKGNIVSYAERLNKKEGETDSEEALKYLYFSPDHGKTWSTHPLPRLEIVKEMFVSSDSELYMLERKISDSFWTLLYSNNAGKSWNEIQKLPLALSSPIISRNHLYFLTYRDPTEMFSFDLRSKKRESYHFQSNFGADAINESDSGVVVFGTTQGHIGIITINLSGIPAEHLERTEIKGIVKRGFKIKNQFSIIVGFRNSIGVTNSVMTRSNNNKWENTAVPSAVFDPVAMLNGKIVGYAGYGTFYQFVQ